MSKENQKFSRWLQLASLALVALMATSAAASHHEGESTVARKEFQTSYCIQDQYGNQYNYTVDQQRLFISGSVTNNQGCPGGAWPLLGSDVINQQGRGEVELTAANPEGDSSSCVAAYKLKGLFPEAAWYYQSGYGGQEFVYTTCGAAVDKSALASGKGALK